MTFHLTWPNPRCGKWRCQRIPFYLVPIPWLNAPRVWCTLLIFWCPQNIPPGTQHVVAAGGRDPGGFYGWCAVMALPTGWRAVLVLPMCVLKLCVNHIDVVPFAHGAVANGVVALQKSHPRRCGGIANFTPKGGAYKTCGSSLATWSSSHRLSGLGTGKGSTVPGE